MPFSSIDVPGVLRLLGRIAERPDDLVDLFLERRETVFLAVETRRRASRRDTRSELQVHREGGLAVRLLRDERTWLSSRDELTTDAFVDAARRVARTPPHAAARPTFGDADLWSTPAQATELWELRDRLLDGLSTPPDATERALGVDDTLADAELRLELRRHRRWTKSISNGPISATERESFYSIAIHAPWGRVGSLLTRLDAPAIERLVAAARATAGPRLEPPSEGPTDCVLEPDAAAVLLHEAVAHVLEADLLARGGDPEAAIGVELGSPHLDIFDDPAGAPESVRRLADDEGFPTLRRCLLRAGRIEQPIADAAWARRRERLEPGGGRRGDRHEPPDPRSSHLELIPEAEPTLTATPAEALGDGLIVSRVERGRLDPATGHLRLMIPRAMQVAGGTIVGATGPFAIVGHVAEVLGTIAGTGAEAVASGAGWCAKHGRRLPVWATTPAVFCRGLEIRR
ncbi:MAG: metallopeptidase TldD-related protein [Acidobacteriota bacterium]